jgi:hypothetical protein
MQIRLPRSAEEGVNSNRSIKNAGIDIRTGANAVQPADEASLATSLDTDIERYESMPLEQIEGELHRARINPQPTPQSVRGLVRERLACIKKR